MKTIIYLLSGFALLLTSCNKLSRLPEESPGAGSNEVSVTFSVRCPEMETVTRALTPDQEKQVHDLNLYLFHKKTDVTEHIYTNRNTGTITTNLVKGDYEMSVVANVGRDLGALTQAEVMQYSRTITQVSDLTENNALLMSVQTQLTVNQNMNFPILLQRAVAKVNLSLSVAPAVSGQITIQSVQVIGVPNTMPFFALNRPTDRAELLDYPKQNVVANTLSYSFYMPENAQGINARITDQRQKNRANSPVAATYLHIQGASAGGKVDYFVYLGENNTSDFNTYHNKQYIVQAVIKGVNEVDTRVSTTEMTVAPFAPTYAPGEMAHSQLTVKCTNNSENLFYLSYVLLSGSGSLQIDGVNRTPNTPFLFLSGASQKTAAITYTQGTPGDAEIRFDLTDKYGYAISKQIATNFVIPYFPLEASASAFSQDTAHRPSAFNLAFAEKDYTGKMRIKYELISGSGSLVLNGATVASGASVEYYQSDNLPGSFIATSVGAVKLRFTLTDDYGQTKICETGATIKPLTIAVTPSFEVKGTTHTLTVGGFTGTRRDPCQFHVFAKTSIPVLFQTSITIRADYMIGYYESTSSFRETPKTVTKTITIYPELISASLIYDSFQEYCMGFINSARKLIAQGYYIPTSSVQLKILSVTSDPQGDNTIQFIINNQ